MNHSSPQKQQRPTALPPSPMTGHSPGMAQVVERNIQALLARRRDDDQKKTREERVADNITRFTGSMRFVYLHLGLFGL